MRTPSESTLPPSSRTSGARVRRRQLHSKEHDQWIGSLLHLPVSVMSYSANSTLLTHKGEILMPDQKLGADSFDFWIGNWNTRWKDANARNHRGTNVVL